MLRAREGEPCRRCTTVDADGVRRGGGTYYWDDYCGVLVCDDCSDHAGLVRCYCGWSESGGDGYAELIDAGETIEPEDY